MVGPKLCHIFITDLDDETEHTLTKSAGNTKLGGVADTPEGCAANHKDLNGLEKWLNRNFMRFDKMECEVLQLGKNNPRNQYRLAAAEWESSFAGMDLRVLENKLPVGEQCALKAKKANSLLGCIRQSNSSRSGEVILHICSALVRHRHTGSAVCSSGLPSTGDMGILECIQCINGHGGRHAGVSSVKGPQGI